jgi:hypothetical protein
MKCSWDSFGWDKVPTCGGTLKGIGKLVGKLETFEEFLIGLFGIPFFFGHFFFG